MPEKLKRVSVAAIRKPLTKSQLREIETLIQRSGSEIDYSDISDTAACTQRQHQTVDAVDAIRHALAQAKNGHGRPVDEVFDELENELLR